VTAATDCSSQPSPSERAFAVDTLKNQLEHRAEPLAATAPPPRLWRTEELGAVLRLQLAAPIFSLLEEFEPEKAARLEAVLAVDGHFSGIGCFADLFHLSPPPRELLSSTKDLARSQLANPQAMLPREITLVLFYASLLLLHLRCYEPLSSLNRGALFKGVQWALEQSWLDGEARRLFEEGQRRLK
jgi:hypothetical protein